MTHIEKYIERLKTLQNLYNEGQPQHNAFGIAIFEANEMLVKNYSIPDVVGKSEQLVAFAKYVIDFSDNVNGTPESIVDEFLSK
jgi:hypothetical protein